MYKSIYLLTYLYKNVILMRTTIWTVMEQDIPRKVFPKRHSRRNSNATSLFCNLTLINVIHDFGFLLITELTPNRNTDTHYHCQLRITVLLYKCPSKHRVNVPFVRILIQFEGVWTRPLKLATSCRCLQHMQHCCTHACDQV